MPIVSSAARLHKKKNKTTRPGSLQRAGLVAATVTSLILIGFIFSTALLYANLTRDLPSLEYLAVLLEPPEGILLQPTRLYDRTGQHLLRTLQNPSSGERGYLRLPDDLGQDQAWQESSSKRKENGVHLSPEIVAATLAVNEPNFWSSPGFSAYGLLSGSSPTLAQRLVLDLLLQGEVPGLRRNLRERLLAAQLTSVYGRAKVLEWYLNSTQYGPLIYGVNSAAQVYFNRAGSELSLAQAALIAAVDRAPALNPLNSPEIAIERQKQTLQAMQETSYISQAELDQALSEQLKFSQPEQQTTDPFYPVTELVLDELYNRLGAERLERGGLKVRTTVDYDLQMQVSCAASVQVARTESTPLEEGASVIHGCEAARLLPTLTVTYPAEPGSLVAEVLVLDSSSGQVLALAGDQASNRFRLGESIRPAGSLITPFIYLTSFTRGLGPASLVWDIPTAAGETGQILPNPVYHGPVSLRTAFANDYRSPALQVLGQVGSEAVWRISQQLGLSSLEVQDLESIRSTDREYSDVRTSLLEIGQAYSVFANQGILAGQVLEQTNGANGLRPIQAVLVLEVEDIQGRDLLKCEDPLMDCKLEARPVVSPQLAYLVTDILSDEPARWQSLGHPNPFEIGRPAGAKVGRVENGGQAWAAGFTPQVTTVVWFGEPSADSTALPDHVATSSASALWHAVIQYASRNLAPKSWSIPPGISRLETCYPSGLLPTANCPTTAVEIFLNGNEPTGPDNLYRVYQVNRETGRLATIFTPPELVEDQVFMVFPPDALAWAQASGMPIPPDTYDAIPATSLIQEDLSISSPEMFSHVSETVSIIGTAGGQDFDTYRIQVGKGLNPRHWIQIGETSQTRVQDSLLAEWNVEGLSGLYAVQLQVVTKDQQVKTSIIQVTVDNIPPDVEIIRPLDKQRFIGEQIQVIVLQASAKDDVTLQKVEFYIDDHLVSTLLEPPYMVSWSTAPGTHTLRVKASDLAENVSEARLEFIVVR